MNTIEELDIITRMRGEVMSRQDVTGENLFLAWGYPTVLVLLVEFAALLIWNEDWCAWLWAGIPLIGTPLMIYFLNEDFSRTKAFVKHVQPINKLRKRLEQAKQRAVSYQALIDEMEKQQHGRSHPES